MVEIKTRHDLSQMKSLYLIHPSLDAILEREAKRSWTTTLRRHHHPTLTMKRSDKETDDDSSLVPEPELLSHSVHLQTTTPMDREKRAFWGAVGHTGLGSTAGGL